MNRKDLIIELYKHPLIHQMIVNEILTKKQLINLVILESNTLHEEEEENFNPDGKRYNSGIDPEEGEGEEEAKINQERAFKNLDEWVEEYITELYTQAQTDFDKKLDSGQFQKLFGQNLKTVSEKAIDDMIPNIQKSRLMLLLAYTSQSAADNWEEIRGNTARNFYIALDKWFEENPPPNVDNILIKKVLVKINENHVDNYPKIQEIIDENKIANIVVKYISMFLKGSVDEPEEVSENLDARDSGDKKAKSIAKDVKAKNKFWFDYFNTDNIEEVETNLFMLYDDASQTLENKRKAEYPWKEVSNEITQKKKVWQKTFDVKNSIGVDEGEEQVITNNLTDLDPIFKVMFLDALINAQDKINLDYPLVKAPKEEVNEDTEEELTWKGKKLPKTATKDPEQLKKEFDFTRFLKLNMKIKDEDAVSKISNLYLSPLHALITALQKELEDAEEESFQLKDPTSMRDVDKDLEDIEVNKDKLDKVVPFAINKSGRLTKAITKMIKFLEKSTLKDTSKPEIGKPVTTDRGTLGVTSEELKPKVKTREEIRDLLNSELSIQEDFMAILKFYYDNFMAGDDKIQDLKTNKGKIKEFGQELFNKIKDMKNSFGTKGTFVPTDKTFFKVTDEILEAFSKTEFDETLLFEIYIRDLPKLVKVGYERLEKVYEEVKNVLSDLEQGKYEMSSNLANILSGLEGLKGGNPKDWFDQVISDLKNNKPMTDFQGVFEKISKIENTDVAGLKPDVEPEPIAEVEGEEGISPDVATAQKQFRRDFEEFNGHKEKALKGIQGLRQNLDSVDQEKYFKFFQLAGLVAEVLGEYGDKQTAVNRFIGNTDNIPKYIDLAKTVADKESLLENGKFPTKYAEQVYNSIGRQKELQLTFSKQDPKASGGISEKDVMEFTDTLGTTLDVIALGAALIPGGQPLAAMLKAPGVALTVFNATMKAKNGDTTGAIAELASFIPMTEVIKKIPGGNTAMEFIVKKLGSAVGEKVSEEVLKKAVESAVNKAAQKSIDVAAEQAPGMFGKLKNKLGLSDEVVPGTAPPDEKVEKFKELRQDIIRFTQALKDDNAEFELEDQGGEAGINKKVGELGKKFKAGDMDAALAELTKLRDNLEKLAPEKAEPGEPPKQEQIERALKPIIEQLLRGKYGKEELYY